MALTRIKTDQVLDGTITNDDLASDIALNTSGDITTSGDVSTANITMTGELNGPATFYIDPAPHDPDTDGATNGLVVIRGDLQIDGTTTTINSTTLTVDDKNITLASGAANAAAADGAGITVDGVSATILYDGTDDEWDFNKNVHISGELHLTSSAPYIDFFESDTTDVNGRIVSNASRLRFQTVHDDGTNADNRLVIDHVTGDVYFYDTAGNIGMAWDASVGSDGSLLVGGHTTLRSGSVGGGNDAQLSLESTNYHYATFIENQNNAAGYNLFIGKSRGTSAGDVDIVQDGDTVGEVTFVAADGTDVRPKIASVSAVVTTGTTPAVNQISGDLVFSTTNQGQNPTAHMRITNEGKVGIGTSTPGSNHSKANNLVVGSGSAGGMAIFNGTAEGWYAFSRANANNTDSYDGGMSYDGDRNLKFHTNAGSTRITIDGSGNVGINTDDPDALLHISGTSPHIDVGPQGGNRAKFGYHDLDVYIGSTSSTGEIIFKNNISSTDAPQTSGDQKMIITDTGVGIGDFGALSSGAKLEVVGEASGNWISIIKNTHNSNGGGLKVLAGDDADTTSFRVSTYDNTTLFDVRGDGEVTATRAYNTNHVRHNIAPTLNFDFASSKKLDPRLSFHRNSHATYYDKLGILRRAGTNEPRFDHDPETGESKGLLIESQRTNLNTYSTDMFNDWARASVTVHQNMEIAPDGTHTADLVVANQNSSARHFLYKGQSIITAGVTYTFSVYIKPYNSPTQSFRLGYRVDSDTQPGDQYVTPTVIKDNLPNGWQRVAITVTVGANPSVGLGQMIIGPTNGYTPTKLEGYYVWGYQVEIGDNVSSYIPSIESFNQRSSRGTLYDEDGILCNAGEDDPRVSYHYNGRKFVEMGMLREPASENVWTNSGLESSRSLIAATGSTTRTNFYDTAPDGSEEAVRIQWSNGYAYRVLSNTLGDSDPWAISFYIKPYSGIARFGFGGTFGSQYWTFNFDTLAVANSAAHANTTLQYGFIRDVGNGWYRVEITFLSTGSSGYTEIQWSGTGSADYAIWGVQFEQNKYSATSFIYSGDSTTTRSADLFLASTSNNRADDNVEMNFEEYASDKFTFYGEVETRDANAGRIIALAPSDTDTSNIISINLESSYFRYYQYSEGALQFNGTTQTYTTNTPLKFAGSWAENDVAYTVNGATPSTMTPAPLYTWKHLRIGSMNPGQYHFQGTIKKITYYDEQLTDAQITALTEND